jgi:hypothetical protein
MKIYIGHDAHEQAAFDTAEKSLHRHASRPVCVTALKTQTLADVGLLQRLQDKRGRTYDFASQALCSTDFAISRFIVPLLAHSGWALFVDCDVVFLGDVYELLALADPEKAVMVVQHAPLPTAGYKMNDQVQLAYPRKNWSSVMLFNCDHPANRRLSLRDVNERPGRDLHRFYWLADSEIGALPPEWNWLVGVQPKPVGVKIAHYTLGGPWLPTWPGAEWDEIWMAEAIAKR